MVATFRSIDGSFGADRKWKQWGRFRMQTCELSSLDDRSALVGGGLDHENGTAVVCLWPRKWFAFTPIGNFLSRRLPPEGRVSGLSVGFLMTATASFTMRSCMAVWSYLRLSVRFLTFTFVPIILSGYLRTPERLFIDLWMRNTRRVALK